MRLASCVLARLFRCADAFAHSPSLAVESSGRANCVQLSDAAFIATGLPPGLLVPRHYDVKGKGLMTTHVLEAGSSAAMEVLELLSTDGAAAGNGGSFRASLDASRRVGRVSQSLQNAAARLSRPGLTSPRTSFSRATPRYSITSGAAMSYRSPRVSRGSAGVGAGGGHVPHDRRSLASADDGEDAAPGAARALRAALLGGAPVMAALAHDGLLRLAGAAAPSAATPLFAALLGPLTAAVFVIYAALLLLALASPAELPTKVASRLHLVAPAAHAAASALATPLLLSRHVAGDAACASDASLHGCVRAFFWRAHAPGAALAWLASAMPPRAVGFAVQLPAAAAYTACAIICAVRARYSRAGVAAVGALAACEAGVAHLLLIPLVLFWALDAPGAVHAPPFAGVDLCPVALRSWRERLRRWALRARVAAGWDDPRDVVLDSSSAGALIAAHAVAQLRRSANDSLAATGALVLLAASGSRAARRRARARGNGEVSAFDAAVPQPRGADGELSYAVRHEMDEREKALTALRTALTTAANEDALLRAGATALAALFPDAAAQAGDEQPVEGASDSETAVVQRIGHKGHRTNAFALGTFAEGSGVDVVASLLVVSADERGRRALSGALRSDVGTWQPQAPSSVAVTCGPGARMSLLDSRDAPAGLRAFSDWAAAVDAGLRTRVAVTLPLCAGPVVVGFVQLHRPGAPGGLEARLRDHGVLRELADALGGSLFVRCAFALNRGGVSRMPAARRTSVITADEGRRSNDSEGRGSLPTMTRVVSYSRMAASDSDDLAWENLQESAAADREILLDWTLDPWTLADDEVQRLIVSMLDSVGLLRRFNMSPGAVARFVEDVALRYNSCPFRAFPA